MEQIDRISLFSEIFWIILVFIFFYFWVVSTFIPSIYISIKIRIYLRNKYKYLVKKVYICWIGLTFYFKEIIRERIKRRRLMIFLHDKLSHSKQF